MIDPAIAIALAGVVLAIALTLRYSRPVPGIGMSPVPREEPRRSATLMAIADDNPPLPAPIREEHAHARLAALLPPDLTLFARVSRDAPDQAGPASCDRVHADLIVCDAMLRPRSVIVRGNAGRIEHPDRLCGDDPDRARLPVVTIPLDADRATIAALLAPPIDLIASPRPHT